MTIQPQAGPQEAFLASPADIAIMGGAAGCGKSYGILMEPLRHKDNGKFGSVCFRRESPQITAEGGLWDTSFNVYGDLAEPLQSPQLHWTFPSGAQVTFSHLQYDKTVKNWDGSQIALLMFDELQHFSAYQFFYMLSRNRSISGVKPYVRASCNPDPDSFLLDFLSWWIDPETGYPIPERSGVLRWMIRSNNVIYWGDSFDEMKVRFPDGYPKSVTFIPGHVTDNKILLAMDPGYVANLNAMVEYERQRLFEGNWFARPSAGDLFKKHYFHMVDMQDLPELELSMRYWDRAATVPSDINPDPDWTAGVLVGVDLRGNYYVMDVEHDRQPPLEVQYMVHGAAERDTIDVSVGIEQEPGASGVMEADTYVRALARYDVQTFPKTKNKLTCWKPAAAQVKAGNVFVVRGAWNEAFFNELSGVTDGSQKGHDDQADAFAGAFNYLSEKIEKNRGPVTHKKAERITSNYRKRKY